MWYWSFKLCVIKKTNKFTFYQKTNKKEVKKNNKIFQFTWVKNHISTIHKSKIRLAHIINHKLASLALPESRWRWIQNHFFKDAYKSDYQNRRIKKDWNHKLENKNLNRKLKDYVKKNIIVLFWIDFFCYYWNNQN